MKNFGIHCWLAIVSAVCLFGIGTAIAAPPQTDSLTQEFKKATTDSAKIAILTEMARRVPLLSAAHTVSDHAPPRYDNNYQSFSLYTIHPMNDRVFDYPVY